MTDQPGSQRSVQEFIDSLDGENTIRDCRALIEMMRRVSGHEPVMWNVGTVGFDSYHYRYASGREGDGQAIGFHPRRGRTTIYLMDGTARHAQLLARLGKHTTSRVCLHVKSLSDVDPAVLERVVQESYDYVKAHDGQMHRVE